MWTVDHWVQKALTWRSVFGLPIKAASQPPSGLALAGTRKLFRLHRRHFELQSLRPPMIFENSAAANMKAMAAPEKEVPMALDSGRVSSKKCFLVPLPIAWSVSVIPARRMAGLSPTLSVWSNFHCLIIQDHALHSAFKGLLLQNGLPSFFLFLMTLSCWRDQANCTVECPTFWIAPFVSSLAWFNLFFRPLYFL